MTCTFLKTTSHKLTELVSNNIAYYVFLLMRSYKKIHHFIIQVLSIMGIHLKIQDDVFKYLRCADSEKQNEKDKY